MKKVAILILAAGKSSRMGAIKQLLKIDGKTLLEIAIENATKSNAREVFCVLGANSEKILQEISPEKCLFIMNEAYASGLNTSIVFGIEKVEKHPKKMDAVLIVLADQPTVDFTYLNQLISVYQKNATKIIASSYQKNKGVPAIFPEKYFEELKQLKKDSGAKKILKLHESDCIEIPKNKPFIDLDTQREYQKYLLENQH